MSGDLAEQLFAHLSPIADESNLLLEDVRIVGEGRRKVVRAVVDLPDGPGGVDSDQLAEVSRTFGKKLDQLDLVRGTYSLEVSTPGIDRPLTTPRHFRRAIGRSVRIVTPQRTVEGVLEVAGEDSATVDGVEIPIGEITSAKMIVDFRVKE